MNRMSPKYKFGIWIGMRNNNAECFTGNPDGVFRPREITRLEPQCTWYREAINSVIGVPWRLTNGRWTVDKPDVRPDPIPIPPLPFAGARIQWERNAKHDVDEIGATVGVQVATRSRTGKAHKPTLTVPSANRRRPQAQFVRSRKDRRSEWQMRR